MNSSVICCNTFFEGFEELKAKLLQRKVDLSQRHIVIVPDRYTLEAEQKLVSQGGGAFDLEVMTFRRMCALLFPDVNYISKQGSAAIFGQLVSQYQGELECFDKMAHKKNFAATLLETISQIKSCGISPDKLQGGGTYMQNKLHDIAYLYQIYEKYLKENALVDAAGLLNMLRLHFMEADLSNTHFYVANFYTATRQIYQLLGVLARKAASFCAVVVHKQQSRLYNNEHLDTLLQYIGTASIKQAQPQNTPFGHILTDLYTNKTVNEDRDLSIFEGENLIGEILHTARTIRMRVVEQGLKYADVGVVCNTQAHDIFARVFEAFEIPFYFEKKKSMLEYPLASFVLNALKVCEQNFKQKYVFGLCKNIFCGIDKQEADCLQLVCEEYSINFSNFLQPNFGIENCPLEQIEQAEQARQHLLDKLARFLKQLECATQPKDFCKAILDLLESCGAEQIVKQLEQTDSYARQAYNMLLQLLAQLQGVMPATKMTLSEFYQCMEDSLSDCKLSVLPQGVDCVQIGTADMFLSQSKKLLFVLEFNDGVNPATKADVGLISDYEINDLRKNSAIDLTPKVSFVNAQQRNILLQAMSIAHGLVLCYSSQSLSGEALKPAQLVRQISALYKSKTLISQKESDILAFYDSAVEEQKLNRLRLSYCCSTEAAKHHLVSAAQGFLRQEINGFSHTARALLHRFCEQEQQFLVVSQPKFHLDVPLHPQDTISVSALEKYFSCPYRYFVDYGLKPFKERRQKDEAVELGNFLHKVLELFGKKLLEAQKNKQPILQEQFVEQSFESAVKFFEEKGVQIEQKLQPKLLEESHKVCAEVVAQLQGGDFKLLGNEIWFGEGGIKTASLAHGRVQLVGKIDRVDVCSQDIYARVVDYKSGAEITYSPQELFVGKKIQPFIYLHILAQQGYVPLGAFYFRVHPKKEQKLRGVFVATRETIKMFDKHLAAGQSSNIVNIRLYKDGSYLESSERLSDAYQMQKLVDYAVMLSEQAMQQLLDGNITPSPLEGTCEFCEHRLLCGFLGNERQPIPVTNEDIINLVEEVSKHD